jgi:hypothetical protein
MPLIQKICKFHVLLGMNCAAVETLLVSVGLFIILDISSYDLTMDVLSISNGPM